MAYDRDTQIRFTVGWLVLDEVRPGFFCRVLLVLLTVYALALILPEPYRLRHPPAAFGAAVYNNGLIYDVRGSFARDIDPPAWQAGTLTRLGRRAEIAYGELENRMLGARIAALERQLAHVAADRGRPDYPARRARRRASSAMPPRERPITRNDSAVVTVPSA